MEMTDLSSKQAKWLTYLVYILIVLISGTVMFQFKLIADQDAKIMAIEQRASSYHHPEKYVTLERYSSDVMRLCTTLDKVEAKLDRLIERNVMFERDN